MSLNSLTITVLAAGRYMNICYRQYFTQNYNVYFILVKQWKVFGFINYTDEAKLANTLQCCRCSNLCVINHTDRGLLLLPTEILRSTMTSTASSHTLSPIRQVDIITSRAQMEPNIRQEVRLKNELWVPLIHIQNEQKHIFSADSLHNTVDGNHVTQLHPVLHR